MMMGSVARQRLKDIGLMLINPSILKLGAAVDIVCFDKTGTLTASNAHLHGVLPLHQAAFTSLQQSALRWSNRLKQAWAVCHSLNMVSKSVVAGVDMERALFKAVEARFLILVTSCFTWAPAQDRETVVLPRTPDTLPPARTVRLTMVRVFEFSSYSLRSGAVVIPSDVSDGSGLLFPRGAPDVIRSLVRQESVPPDFDKVVDQYSSDSFRLLALAVGVISDVHKVDLLRLTRAGGGQVLAVSSFGSKPSVTMSNHDGPAMPPPLALPLAQSQQPLEGLRFQMAGGHCLDASEVVNALAEGQMQCAVTGDALEALLQQHDPSLLETVLRNAVVFSRMKPHQKGQVMDLLGVNGINQLINGRLRYIPGMGMTTMFCGDGINDLPALAAADVGMSIGATDAVIAAALSTSRASIAVHDGVSVHCGRNQHSSLCAGWVISVQSAE
ncbi:hypothetical protein WJX82_006960 [Trebouxia sp. C0006]